MRIFRVIPLFNMNTKQFEGNVKEVTIIEI